MFKKTVAEVLASPQRAAIIVAIDKKDRGFAELQKLSNLSSGTLGYHLLKAQVSGVITKDQNNKYSITPLGRKVTVILEQIGESSNEI
jgi:DNA-binding HxlR family transcriptional regulator